MPSTVGTIVILGMLLLGGLLGCGGPPPPGPPPDMAAVEPTPPPRTPDHVLLKEGLQGREMSPGEVANLSDRLLGNGASTLQDQETMARLELLLLKALKTGDKASRPTLWRNLGIIHYHQKKYKLARQELQQSNELYPKSARTHFYLARLFAHQGIIEESKGKKKVSKQQFKRAAIEMEQARKLEPQNSLYRQDIRQIVQSEAQ
ncbi:MAG: tetratricopeptide repeat protein [Deltaproteobacteria bacterium]|nr:tetratricopeptide repeat protein [Deltaproteobacteria bacterium]